MQTLCNKVASGQLELIHILGLPRSNGTALEIALTQLKEVTGQLNEPFYYHDMKGRRWDFIPSPGEEVRSFETGCAFIAERVAEEKGEKVQLVVHDLVQDLSLAEFEKLQTLNRHLIFTIRDPKKHALSMLTRYTNDLLSQPGGNLLKSSDVLKFMSDALTTEERLAFVKTLGDKFKIGDEGVDAARQKVIDRVIEEYNTPWENMEVFYHNMKEKHADHPYTVYDGGMLFSEPEKSLPRLVEKIKGLTYSLDMINNWTKGVKEQFRCIITRNWGDFAMVNAWNGPVRNSTGITKQNDSFHDELDIAIFPAALREHILNKYPIYKEMTASKEAI